MNSPAADTVERGVEYVLLPSRVKYVTYDSAFRSVVSRGTVRAKELPAVARVQKNFVYPIKDTGEEWITYDNIEWTLIDQDKSLQIVETLPDVTAAIPNVIYIEKPAGLEWITYDNREWTLLDQDKSLQIVKTLPAVDVAIPNVIYIEKPAGLEWITYDNLKWTCLNGSNENNRTLIRVVDSLADLAESPADYMYVVKETHDLYFIFDEVEVPAALNSFVLCDGSAATKAASADAPDLLCFY
jgi:hypothetical protein